MSEREVQRVEMLLQVLAGRMTVVAAAGVLALSRRRVHRPLGSDPDGGAVLRHRARGLRLHQPRLRRERLGELVQVDVGEHWWSKARSGPCTLLAFVDDATGRLLQLRFVVPESAL